MGRRRLECIHSLDAFAVPVLQLATATSSLGTSRFREVLVDAILKSTFPCRKLASTMNTSIDAARDLLQNPTEELKATLAGGSHEAKAAISSIVPEGSSLNGLLKTNGTNGDVHEAAGDNTARLQVVDEVRLLSGAGRPKSQS